MPFYYVIVVLKHVRFFEAGPNHHRRYSNIKQVKVDGTATVRSSLMLAGITEAEFPINQIQCNINGHNSAFNDRINVLLNNIEGSALKLTISTNLPFGHNEMELPATVEVNDENRNDAVRTTKNLSPSKLKKSYTIWVVMILSALVGFVLGALYMKYNNDCYSNDSLGFKPIVIASNEANVTGLLTENNCFELKFKMVNESLGESSALNTSLIRFFIYGKASDNEAYQEILFGNKSSFHEAKINHYYEIIIIIHGFLTNFSRFSSSTNVLKNAYLQREFYNILVVDWYALAGTNGAILERYNIAVSNVEGVGKYVGEFMKFIIEASNNKIKSSQFHLVGHSLGSHVCGVAGFTFNRLTNGRLVGHITGLDPAYPLYNETDDLTKRLDPSDATFVDIFHTNIWLFGIPYPSGDVDIYVNGGGPFQPNCVAPTSMHGVIKYDTASDIITRAICSHSSSYHIYAKSIINEKKYYGCLCEIVFPNHTKLFEFEIPPLSKIEYGCVKIINNTSKCKGKTVFGQFVLKSVRGLYNVEFDMESI